jgi:hypothetical protein
MVAETLRDILGLQRRVERLERVEVPPYTVNLRSFGGKTSATYTKNDTAFTQAFEALADKGGGTLIVPGNGTFYRKSTPILLPYSNICLKFEPGASVRLEDGAGTQCIAIGNWNVAAAAYDVLTDIVLEGVNLDGNGFNQTRNASVWTFPYPGSGQWCSQVGIEIRGARRLTIRDCLVRDTVNTAVAMTHCGQITIDNCRIYNAALQTVAGWRNGIGWNSGDLVDTTPYVGSRGLTVTNCLVYGMSDLAIGVSYHHNNASHTIVNNHIVANWDNFPVANLLSAWGPVGIGMEGDSDTLYPGTSIIKGNHIWDCTIGINAVCNTANRVPPLINEMVDISHNHIYNPEIVGIQFGGVGIDIESNKIYNVGCQTHWTGAQYEGYGIRFQDANSELLGRQTVAISGTPTGGHYHLIHNGNTTGDIAFDASAATVETALRLLPTLAAVTVTATGVSPNFTHTVLFVGVAGIIPSLTADATALTGGTPVITIVVIPTTIEGDVIIADNYVKSAVNLAIANPFTSIRSGISIDSAAKEIKRRIDIHDNILEGPGLDLQETARNGGIFITGQLSDAAPNGAQLVMVHHNRAWGWGHGLRVNGAVPGLVIDGNDFSLNSDCGMYLVGTSTRQMVNPIIHNNVAKNNGQLAGLFGCGILLSYVTNAQLDNNILNDDQTVATQLHGIRLATGVANIRMTGGELIGNVTNPIYLMTLAAFDYVRNVNGLNPRGAPTAPPALPLSTVTGTNTSGVDCTMTVTGGTVTVIVIQGVTTNMTSGAFFLPAMGTFAITYSSAPTLAFVGH